MVSEQTFEGALSDFFPGCEWKTFSSGVAVAEIAELFTLVVRQYSANSYQAEIRVAGRITIFRSTDLQGQTLTRSLEEMKEWLSDRVEKLGAAMFIPPESECDKLSH